MRKIIALVGPTASGKTDIAINLALKLGGEIISADSRLVYNDFNIGTAKPTKEEMQAIPHHMIDIASPEDDFTVSIYKKQANAVINDIFNRGKVPIVAGGTGFYIKTLLEGHHMPEASPDEEFRQEMAKLGQLHGRKYLHDRLMEIDPVTAEKLYVNDSFRVIRALEVYHTLGKTMSEARSIIKPDFDTIYIGLNSKDRDFLYERINRRVEIMLEVGLIDEVKSLINKYGKTVSLLKTLGYKEISDHFDGFHSLDEAVEIIKKNTRNFAKRQLTWFRANKDINWYYIDINKKDELIRKITEQCLNMM